MLREQDAERHCGDVDGDFAILPARDATSRRLAPHPWEKITDSLGIGRDDLGAALDRASGNGTSLPEELFAAHLVTQERYCRALADLLGLRFEHQIHPSLIVMKDAAGLELLSRSSDFPYIRYYCNDAPI